MDDIYRFSEHHEVQMVRFRKGQRKDDKTQKRLKAFDGTEGVLYIGIAQEKFGDFRTTKKTNPDTGKSFPSSRSSSTSQTRRYSPAEWMRSRRRSLQRLIFRVVSHFE